MGGAHARGGVHKGHRSTARAWGDDMSRRRRVSAVAFALTAVVAAVLVPTASRPAAGADVHPNVVVILTDDQRWTTLPIMHAVDRTLVERGVHFANAFVSTPVCCPSRATYLTGLHA